MMKTEFKSEMVGIKAINLLFFNYTTEMLDEMKELREFRHCWENYVDFKKQTYMQIWELYLTKISYKTQMYLLEIALKYYGEEADRSFTNAVKMDILMEEHIAKHSSKKI